MNGAASSGRVDGRVPAKPFGIKAMIQYHRQADGGRRRPAGMTAKGKLRSRSQAVTVTGAALAANKSCPHAAKPVSHRCRGRRRAAIVAGGWHGGRRLVYLSGRVQSQIGGAAYRRTACSHQFANERRRRRVGGDWRIIFDEPAKQFSSRRPVRPEVQHDHAIVAGRGTAGVSGRQFRRAGGDNTPAAASLAAVPTPSRRRTSSDCLEAEVAQRDQPLSARHAVTSGRASSMLARNGARSVTGADHTSALAAQ